MDSLTLYYFVGTHSSPMTYLYETLTECDLGHTTPGFSSTLQVHPMSEGCSSLSLEHQCYEEMLSSLKLRNKHSKQVQVYFLHGFLKISSIKLINVRSQKHCQQISFFKIFSFFLNFPYVYWHLCIFDKHILEVDVLCRLPM